MRKLIPNVGYVLAILPVIVGVAWVQAAPSNSPEVKAYEKPTISKPGPRATVGSAPPQLNTYGFCSGPQNALDFPSTPVPVVTTRCEHTQTFTGTSVAPSNAPGDCGGYSVAFGPLGDLKREMTRVHFEAEWAEAPITTAAACATARVAADAWGYRCENDACTSGAHERIGFPHSSAGSWSAAKQSCTVRYVFNAEGHNYKSLNLNIITSQMVNGSRVRKRARGIISVSRGNGQCYEGTAP